MPGTAERGPSQLETIRFLYAFSHWTRPRVLTAAHRLSDADLWRAGVISGGAGDGSVFETLAHLAGAERMWLGRWRGEEKPSSPAARSYSDLEALATAWEEAEQEQSTYLDGLTNEELGQPFSFFSPRVGRTEQFLRGEALLQVMNHTTHHRSEACVGLTALGQPPESTDLVDYIRSLREPL